MRGLGTANWPGSFFIPPCIDHRPNGAPPLGTPPPAAPSTPAAPRLSQLSRTRPQARREVITLYAQGWSKRSISQFLHVSRPTITAWITRFEADNTASLEDQSRAPHTPVRKAWLPVMVEIYHLQKRHPDAGGFRIWSLRGKTDLSVRTVERIMALNRHVYTDIPGTEALHAPPAAPQPHPFKATAAHEYWFIDGRMMDFALEGHRWWSLIILDGYSRTMLAGAVAPTEASWVALTVLYTRVSALWRPRPPDFRQRRGLHLRRL